MHTLIFCNQYLTSNNVAPKARQKTIGPAKSVSFMMLPSATFNGCSTVSVFCQMWSKLIPNSTNYMKRIMHIYFSFPFLSCPFASFLVFSASPLGNAFQTPSSGAQELSHSIFPPAAERAASTDSSSQMPRSDKVVSKGPGKTTSKVLGQPRSSFSPVPCPVRGQKQIRTKSTSTEHADSPSLH